MPNQPLPRNTAPKTGPQPANTAIPVSSDQHSSAGKKKMMNLIIIFTILFFGGSAVYIFGKGKLFGTGDGGGGGVSFMANAKPTWETPREPLPMGQYTGYFGKAQTFIQKDPSGAKRGLYYYLHSPAGASPMVAKKYPLVIYLHDEKGIANPAVTLLSKSMQQNYPAYVLVPMAAARKTWSVPTKFQGQEFTGKAKSQFGYWSQKHFPPYMQSINDVMSIAATLMTRLPIDDGRVYIAGCSEGGVGVYGALANYPEFFAGGVVASGVWSFNDAKKLAETPLLIMHGGKDLLVPPLHAQMMGQVIQQVGGKQVVYQEFPDLARNCDDPRLFSAPVWGWLFQQKKPALPAAPAPVAAPAAVQSTDPDAAPEMMPEMQKPPPPPMTAP